MLFGGATHWVSQVPQCAGLVCVSTHERVQAVRVPQSVVQTPFRHTWSKLQATSHAPQKSPSDSRSTQSIPHCVKPGLQLTPQDPFTQAALPPPVIGGAHVSPQPPQFWGFAVVSTQIPPHNAKPSLHAAPQVPL